MTRIPNRKNLPLNIRILVIFLQLIPFSLSGQPCIPTLKDIYDLPIGMKFRYKTLITHEAGYEDIITEQYEILDKWSFEDTLVFARKGIRLYVVHPDLIDIYDTISIGEFTDQIVIVDSLDHFLNACDSQLVKIDYYVELYSKIKILDSLKLVGGQDNLFINNDIDNLIPQDTNDPMYTIFYQEFIKNIGLWYEVEGNMMSIRQSECEGYVINDQIFGFYDNNFILSTPEYFIKPYVTVYPTIIDNNNVLSIESDTEYNDVYLFSIIGTKYYLPEIFKGSFDTSKLPQGIYFLIILFDNSRESKKIIKLN